MTPLSTEAVDSGTPTIGGDPAYLDILSGINQHGAAFNTALLNAHVADTADARRVALVDLHARLRRMAATANAAIGAWSNRNVTQP